MNTTKLILARAALTVAEHAYDAAVAAADAAGRRRCDAQNALALVVAAADGSPTDAALESAVVTASEADEISYHEIVVAELALRAARFARAVARAAEEEQR